MMLRLSRPAALLLLAMPPTSAAALDLCAAPTDGSRYFTSSLMPKVYSTDGTSGSFSPASIRQAFFMVGEAAAPTPDGLEIRDGFKVCSPSDPNVPFADLASPVVDLAKESKNFNLTIANALYVDATFPIRQSYADTLKASYGAEATTVDFANQPTEAKDTINRFVKEKTKGIIPAILGDDPRTDTVIFLVNALYLGARWAQSFDPAYPRVFYPFGPDYGKAKMVQTMSAIRTVPYYDGGTYTAASLPYKEEGYEMLFIRPSGCTSPTTGQAMHLDNLVGSCLDATLAEAVANTGGIGSDYSLDKSWESSTKLRMMVPKFHVKWRSESELMGALKDLGVRTIFDANTANLYGMVESDAATSVGRLAVTQVVHQADVKVNEQGTEAAAATAVGISVTSMPMEPDVQFKLDVPFLYALVHRPLGTVFFSGWVNVDAMEVIEDAEFDDGTTTEPKMQSKSAPVCLKEPVCGSPPPDDSLEDVMNGSKPTDIDKDITEQVQDSDSDSDSDSEDDQDPDVQSMGDSGDSSSAPALSGGSVGIVMMAGLAGAVGILLA